MNKIIIALGLTLAAATGAFAQADFNYDNLPGASYGTEVQSGVDYTATASVGGNVADTAGSFNYSH